MCSLIYKKYSFSVIISIFIIYFFCLVDLVFSFEVPHAFTILEETSSQILIQYQVQKLPSLSEIQSDIDEINSEQEAIPPSLKATADTQADNPPSHEATVGRQPASIAHRTLVGIPENVEPSIEVLKTDWEKINLNAEGSPPSHEATVGRQADNPPSLKATAGRQADDPPSREATVGRQAEDNGSRDTGHDLINVTTGYLRHQRIAIVEIHPLKCEASNFYFAKNIVFKIVLKPTSGQPVLRSTQSAISNQRTENRDQRSDANSYYASEESFEEILKKNILNYSSLNRKKVVTQHSALVTQNSNTAQHSALVTQNSIISQSSEALPTLRSSTLSKQPTAEDRNRVSESGRRMDTQNSIISQSSEALPTLRSSALSKHPTAEDRNRVSESGRRMDTQNSIISQSSEALPTLRSSTLHKQPTAEDSNRVSESGRRMDTQYSSITPPLSPLKITVKDPGIYSVSYDDIKAAGWDPAQINPTKLQLINMGKDIPILFYGEEDHSFDSGDYFLFYGTPTESNLTHDNASNKFIFENVYWLYLSESNHTRVLKVQNKNSNAKFIQDYSKILHLERDIIMVLEHIDFYLWAAFPDLSDKERQYPNIKSFIFNIDNINNDKEPILIIRFMGGNNIPSIDPDHHIKISINDIWSEETYFDGLTSYRYTKKLPLNILHEGENTITISTVGDTESDENLFYLDFIEIDYRRFLKSINNELSFSINPSNTYNIKVDGFSNDSLLLFDITDPQNILKIEGFETTSTAGNYSITFGEQAGGGKAFIALTMDRANKPVSVSVDETSDLKNTANRADYIIITHEDFYDEIQRLANHRQVEGYTVKVVKIQDIYDEFNNGIMHPQAIKDFLTYASNKWAPPAPTFVLLVGDGCSDATDRLQLNNKNFVPCRMYSYRYPRPTDLWYAQVNGDDILPDIIIGRIPVKSVEQLRNVIDKIINYENSPITDWMRNVQFIAGPYNEAYAYDNLNNDLSGYVPFNYYSDQLKSDEFTGSREDKSKKVANKINAGRIITVYTGHSNIEEWTNIFNTSQFIALKNIDKPTFLMSFSCSPARFSNPLVECFAEEFLRIANGGGVACFSPSSGGNLYEHRAMSTAIFKNVFINKINNWGSATTQAITEAYLAGILFSADELDKQTFLGDPATKFKICEFNLESPADTTSISSNAQFTWFADGYNRCKIQFSPYPDFSKFPVLSYITTEPSFTPNVFVNARLSLMAKNNGTIYWRVGGMKSREEYSNDSPNAYLNDIITPVFYCQPWSFTIQ